MTRKYMLVSLLLASGLVLLIILFAGPTAEEAHQLRRVAVRASAANNLASDLQALQPGSSLAIDRPTRILNFTDFRLVLDAKCNHLGEENVEDWQVDSGGTAKAVWIITSYAGDTSKRSALRRAYTSEELKQLGVRRIFLLGSLDDNAKIKTGVTQEAIENEAHRYRDIVQGNFVEAYRNLTYKHLMGLQWAAERCGDSYSLIMKMDDDIVVNLYEAMDLLTNKYNTNFQEDFLIGYVMENMSPVRNTASKWFVKEEEFPNEVYPDFLSGWFYAIDIRAALKLIYQSKHHFNYFWIDDLFVTGILREEIGIQNFINIKDLFTTDYRFLECCLKYTESQPKYKCDFIFGPDGAQKDLVLTFKEYSKDCYQRYNCTRRPKEQLLKNKCILNYKNINLATGRAQIESLA
ncbi:acetylgalactosaminyl-O-glycosyl-glycoprotein beta-1,3-N-acetylglucosaminyltransferase-like [Copidosoma floridanum]|uniref:acetylgalactosaminyl-O-glycosyl-glycoprotein beta-1,3-N-acetylglucosaminyltransferase-like n=1 Tax=Copidosoma floridanum TaxID=29053 RepID=UPI0006C9BE82|nr:acetylgalactosaminyl-O-glycosyl-glycoprotein beta-1,3-N-acetylglucosaminyltransferase-like [Copidosoma floridanum]